MTGASYEESVGGWRLESEDGLDSELEYILLNSLLYSVVESKLDSFS